MTEFTRRRFLGGALVGAAALAAPVRWARVLEPIFTPRDDTAWLQAQIDALGPGEKLNLGGRKYQVSKTLEVRGKTNVVIGGFTAEAPCPVSPRIMIDGGCYGVHLVDIAFTGGRPIRPLVLTA